MKHSSILTLISLLVVGCTQFTPTTNSPEEISQTEETVGLANPASVYCEESGGTLEIRSDESGSQSGYCIFPDGSDCEEWAYFRGECSTNQ